MHRQEAPSPANRESPVARSPTRSSPTISRPISAPSLPIPLPKACPATSRCAGWERARTPLQSPYFTSDAILPRWPRSRYVRGNTGPASAPPCRGVRARCCRRSAWSSRRWSVPSLRWRQDQPLSQHLFAFEEPCAIHRRKSARVLRTVLTVPPVAMAAGDVEIAGDGVADHEHARINAGACFCSSC
jgi:hypothetical protein